MVTIADRWKQLLLIYRYGREKLSYSRFGALRLVVALHGDRFLETHLAVMMERMREDD